MMKNILIIFKFLKWIRSSYFNFPLLIDGFIISLVLQLDYRYGILSPILNEINIDKLPSNLITGSLTLLGFFITAITIIISFEGVYKVQDTSSKKNAFSIFLSSKKQYGNLLKVFRSAVWIVFLDFIFLITIETLGTNFPEEYKMYAIVLGFFILITATLRSLYTLHLVINVISQE